MLLLVLRAYVPTYAYDVQTVHIYVHTYNTTRVYRTIYIIKAAYVNNDVRYANV